MKEGFVSPANWWPIHLPDIWPCLSVGEENTTEKKLGKATSLTEVNGVVLS